MEKTNKLGRNRTGIDMSPIHSKEMISGAETLTPPTQSDFPPLMVIEREYIEEGGTVGSVPVPGTMKGVLKSTMEKMTGHNPEVLLNKMGERLAFERSGVRLYEAFIIKCESINLPTPISLDILQQFRAEEEQHFHTIKNAMLSMGADPTAQTPDADVVAVASMGIQKVIQDPRTSLSQCLSALLTAELVDNAGWEILIKLAEGLGLEQITADFVKPLQEEEKHLQTIREWYEYAVMAEAGKKLTKH
ncbi:MAG TPA: ferritin-like domain-containing protein [Gammaproteobacteria bacterium]|nr:ferritin-like domain-containing protein [Gammaproteobacteria bacterium]